MLKFYRFFPSFYNFLLNIRFWRRRNSPYGLARILWEVRRTRRSQIHEKNEKKNGGLLGSPSRRSLMVQVEFVPFSGGGEEVSLGNYYRSHFLSNRDDFFIKGVENVPNDLINFEDIGDNIYFGSGSPELKNVWKILVFVVKFLSYGQISTHFYWLWLNWVRSF